MAGFHSPQIVTDQLGLYLDAFNIKSYPGSGSSWFDLSTNGRTGTLVSSPPFTGEGFTFGVSTGRKVSSISNVGLTHGGNNFTYNCWVKFSTTASTRSMIENGSWPNCLLIRYESGGFGLYGAGALMTSITFAPVVGNWYMLSFVRLGNVVYFYINGTFTSSHALAYTLTISSNIVVGAAQYDTGQEFDGTISTMAIYTKALTDVEIRSNYRSMSGRYGL